MYIRVVYMQLSLFYQTKGPPSQGPELFQIRNFANTATEKWTDKSP